MQISLPSIIFHYQDQFGNLFSHNTKAFAFWKGRVAFHAILEALAIGPGDKVILPGFTCVVVPNAIIYRGAIPVYADIYPYTFNVEVSEVKRKINPGTKAILVQHTFGIPADMDPILELAEQHGIPVIEDCAHALGSRYKSRLVGTLGQAAFFSFQWSKPYSTGLGGMAVTNDPALADRLAQVQARYSRPGRREIAVLQLQGLLYRHLFSPRLFWLATDVLHRLSNAGLFIGSSSNEELECRKPNGYEKRMSAFQAAWGLRELANLESNIAYRKRIVKLYDQLLREAGFKTVEIPSYADPVFVRYPLLVSDKAAVLEYARRKRIEIGSWFESVLHPAESPLKAGGYIPGQCPVGEKIARHIINLPTHLRVTEEEAVRVVEFLKDMRDKGYA